jgi:3-dehydroquinate synthase
MEVRIDVNKPGGGSYPILIQRGLLATITTRAAEFSLDRRVGVIANTTLAPLYGEALCAALPNASLITMPDGEQHKTLDTMASLFAQMVSAGLDRGSTVIALGGGVVGDTAGFAAATFMRGVRLVQVPTSLLAMVDSSVGAKVGVDLPQGKNLVGAFKQPALVLIDPDVLATLPQRERSCGLAEVIKHGLIADPGLLDDVEAGVEDAQLIRRAVQVKVNIVEEDPYEQNIRAYLNLGHTFGHAIEQVSGYAWLHGEAVGVGMIAAARLSHRLHLCDASVVDTVERAVASVGLPQSIEGLEPDALWAAMATDKKWQQGKPRFVLLKDVGVPDIVDGVPREDVITVLDHLR